MILRQALWRTPAMLLLFAAVGCSSGRYQPVSYPLVPPSDYGMRSQRLQPVEGLDEPAATETVAVWTASWMDGPVSLIATDDESETYRELSTEAERTEFIELFWQRRDPEPKEVHNEYLQDFNRRVTVAADLFAVDTEPGWRTPFGIAMVSLGFPTLVKAWDADDELIAPGDYVEAKGGYRVLWQYGLRPEDLQGGTSIAMARLMATPTAAMAAQLGPDPYALNFIYTAGSWRMSCRGGWQAGGWYGGGQYGGSYYGGNREGTVGEDLSPDVAGSGGMANSNPFGFAGPQGRANPAVFHPDCLNFFNQILAGTLRNSVIYP